MLPVEIDRASSVAPYRQIAGWLRSRIDSGELGAGDRLPSAVDLAEQFGVAVLTGRKALGVLVDEGIAYRSIGMGTYIRRREP